jgi:hypothetical protein
MRRFTPLTVLLLLLLLVPNGPPATSAAPNPGLDLDIITGQDVYEANVSNPSVPSVSFVAIIKNNGTLPILNVRLSASVNLGGTATVEPSDTGYIAYQGQTSAVVSATLPNSTMTSLVATLRIDGVCSGTGPIAQVTDFKQVQLTVRQWHSIRIQNVSLSSDSPVEKEVMQVSSRVTNVGNGPTYIIVAAFLDGHNITARANGAPVDPNNTIKVDSGRFILLTASWMASYGHHSVVLEARDVGSPGGNTSSSFSRDTRVVAFFVTFNMRDWIPYILLVGLVVAAVAVAAFRYRRRLAARFPRFRRAFRIKLPPPGPKTRQLQRALGVQVKRARGVAARVGQRPLPRYVSKRVSSDIAKIRSRTIPKGPPPAPEEIEQMKPVEKRGFR